jgi:hypothetical protein
LMALATPSASFGAVNVEETQEQEFTELDS